MEVLTDSQREIPDGIFLGTGSRPEDTELEDASPSSAADSGEDIIGA